MTRERSSVTQCCMCIVKKIAFASAVLKVHGAAENVPVVGSLTLSARGVSRGAEVLVVLTSHFDGESF